MSRLLDRAGLWSARTCIALSAGCLLLLMILTVVEVIGRYLFNAPIFGRQDISQILLAGSIFFALPVVCLRGDQIAVDLFDGMFSARAAFWRDRIIETVTALTFLIMGYWLLDRAQKALSRGTTSELLFLPKYPLIGLIAAIVGLTGLLLLARAAVLALRSGRADPP
ncbi:TRAP transporter small permease [Aestuariibius insulae]|uniref:TRAP transporter small permease n=1 Tax=Aestuariibius insulae TaxID=2058287 RepID=UPI00345E4944